jgi:hypothetical protein
VVHHIDSYGVLEVIQYVIVCVCKPTLAFISFGKFDTFNIVQLLHVTGQVASLIVPPLATSGQVFDLVNERRPIVTTLFACNFVPM